MQLSYLRHDVFIDFISLLDPVDSYLCSPQLNAVRYQLISSLGSCTMINVLDKCKTAIFSFISDGTEFKK